MTFSRIVFALLFAIAGAAALVLLYFFLLGVSDGTVNASTASYWFPMLGAAGAVLAFGWRLRRGGHPILASLLLLVLALPASLYGLVILLFIMSPGSHH